MSDATTEAREIVRLAAEPWAPGDCVKAGINRAARTLGLSYRRARTFWYGAHCAVLSTEMDQLRTRQRFLLAQRMNRLDAERALIAARLTALEDTHAAVVARVARAKVDRRGTVRDSSSGSVSAEAARAGGPAARSAQVAPAGLVTGRGTRR